MEFFQKRMMEINVAHRCHKPYGMYIVYIVLVQYMCCDFIESPRIALFACYISFTLKIITLFR